MTRLEESFEEITYNRRTCKNFTGREVPKEQLETLIKWAVRAPNHHLTQLWRFRICQRAGIQKWLECIHSQLRDDEVKGFEVKSKMFGEAGALIYISHFHHSEPAIHRENYAATCCAAQNILLGASAMGYESFWSTGNWLNDHRTQTYFGLSENEGFVGGLFLGEGKKPPPRPRKPLSEVVEWF